MRQTFFLTLLIGITLAGCSGGGNAEQVAQGEALFKNGTSTAPACTVCHTLDGTTLVGPSLQHIATTAKTRVANQSAEDYIHNSILMPSAYRVAGYETGTMVPNYAASLSTAQVDALVAFLMTQQ